MNVEFHGPDQKNIYVKKRRDISIYILKQKTILVDKDFQIERRKKAEQSTLP